MILVIAPLCLCWIWIIQAVYKTGCKSVRGRCLCVLSGSSSSSSLISAAPSLLFSVEAFSSSSEHQPWLKNLCLTPPKHTRLPPQACLPEFTQVRFFFLKKELQSQKAFLSLALGHCERVTELLTDIKQLAEKFVEQLQQMVALRRDILMRSR